MNCNRTVTIPLDEYQGLLDFKRRIENSETTRVHLWQANATLIYFPNQKELEISYKRMQYEVELAHKETTKVKEEFKNYKASLPKWVRWFM